MKRQQRSYTPGTEMWTLMKLLDSRASKSRDHYSKRGCSRGKAKRMPAPRRDVSCHSPSRLGSPCCPQEAAHSARAGATPIAPGRDRRHSASQALCSVQPQYSRIAPLSRAAAPQPIPLWDRGSPATTAPGPAARTAPAPGPPRKTARGLAGPQRSPPMGRREGGRAARWEARLRARGACREMQSWRRRDRGGQLTA